MMHREMVCLGWMTLLALASVFQGCLSETGKTSGTPAGGIHLWR